MRIDPKGLIDGSLSFEKGVETQKAPARVPRNQLCNLVNGTTRQDYISPRPRWVQVNLRFPDSDTSGVFDTGQFQNFEGYVPDSGPAQLIFSISGKLYRVDAFTDGEVAELILPDPNPTNRPRAWMKQAELFLIWQDGQSVPLIYDGAKIRRSDVQGTSGTDADGTPLKEVPTGTAMEYAGGRLWVALPDGHSFVAGDGVYGPTGTPAYQRRDSILRFTENEYFDGGGAFAVPSNMGPISALKAMSNLDTSLGQGFLQVFTPSGAFSVNAPFDRTLWALLTDPIQTVSLLQYGFLGQDSTIQVNGDIWGRALNGIRSFILARRDFGTWGNRAMSHEVDKWLSRDDQNLLSYGSAALFDDRLLHTTGPYQVSERGVCHTGLVVLDFHPLTEIAQVEQPTWDGLWNGSYGDILRILTVTVRGVDHCFAAVLSPATEAGVRSIQLWKLTRERGPDLDINSIETRISRIVESPLYDFQPSGSNRFEQKLIEAADLWINQVYGTVDFWLYYRPDQYPCWFFWKHWQICAKTRRCAVDATDDGCLQGLNLKPQFRNRIGSARPPDDIIPGTHQPSRLGCGFQYRLEIQGDCDVNAVRLLAIRVTESTFGLDAPEVATCDELICCTD